MIGEYLNRIFEKYQTGDASERTYYPVLEEFLANFADKALKDVSIIIEPKKCRVGIPDFKIKTKKELLIGYVEAKDLGRDLDKLNPIEKSQIDKYLKEYPKLIVTNFVEFRLYENSQKIDTVLITQPITVKSKVPAAQKQAELASLLERFFSTVIP